MIALKITTQMENCDLHPNMNKMDERKSSAKRRSHMWGPNITIIMMLTYLITNSQ